MVPAGTWNELQEICKEHCLKYNPEEIPEMVVGDGQAALTWIPLCA